MSDIVIRIDRRVGLLLAGAVLAAPLWMSAVDVPHTFSNGTAAESDEVNANFAALDAAVDATESTSATNAGNIRANLSSINEATSERAERWATINVRALVTKSDVDAYCAAVDPLSRAIHVPHTWRGRTGTEICAADAPSGDDYTQCVGSYFVYVRNNNTFGRHAPNDKTCSDVLGFPWPWGQNYGSPNTLAGEWGHGNTWAVCCKQ